MKILSVRGCDIEQFAEKEKYIATKMDLYFHYIFYFKPCDNRVEQTLRERS